MAFRNENHDDLKLFKNRLWKLMSENNLTTAKELATALVEKKLISPRQNRTAYSGNINPYDAKKSAIGTVEKRIQAHLSADTINKLQGEYLFAYCTLFNCSADYLLGFIDGKTHQINSAAAEIGLNEITVEQISGLDLIDRHLIDVIFSRSIVSFNLLKTIREMIFYSHPHTKNISKITLDRNLTMRDLTYSDLEKDLNKDEIIDIMTYKLFGEMRSLIKQLQEDKTLSDEIKDDYITKHFHSHINSLPSEELPKLKIDSYGNVVIDNNRTMYDLENKITNRLTKREENGNLFNYDNINISSAKDFKEQLKNKRKLLSEKRLKQDAYIAWLKEIDKKTY